MGILLKYLIISFCLYVFFKFLTRIVLPIFVISRKIKEQQDLFKAQQEQQRYQTTREGVDYVDISDNKSQPSNHYQANTQQQRVNKTKDDEYIDFEEV